MTTDRRRASRIFFDMPAELTVDDTVYHVRQVADLSVGGCLLEIKGTLPVGAACNLDILVDGTRLGLVVKAIGKIVRNEADSVSIKFTQVDEKDRAHLKNIVKYSLPILKLHPEVRAKRP